MHSTRRDFSHVTYSGFDDDGYLLVQADAYGDKGGASFGLNHQYGFASRPHDPEPDGKWCTLLIEKDGSSRIGWLGYDPRFIQDLAVLQKGGAVMYAGWKDGDDWHVTLANISGDTGTLQFYRPTKNGSSDSAIAITAGVDANGEPVVELRNADGSSVLLFGGSLLLKSPNGKNYIQVSDKGIVLKGPITQVGGLSTPGGVPLVRSPEFGQFIEAMTTAFNAIGSAMAVAGTTDPSIEGMAITVNAALAPALAQMATAAAASATTVTKGT